MDEKDAVKMFREHLEALKLLYGYIPFNWFCDTRTDQMKARFESDSKIFLYIVSPVAFGTKFPNDLLSKWADHVGYGRNGHLDPNAHSSAEEEKVIGILIQVQNFMLFLESLPPICVCKAKQNLNVVLTLNDPENVIRFGKEKCACLFGSQVWFSDDTSILLFVITLLLFFNDEFRQEALHNVLKSHVDNIFVCYGDDGLLKELEFIKGVFQEAVLATESAERALRNGDIVDGVKFYTRALKLNPLADIVYNKLSELYFIDEKYEFGRWFAIRSIWLKPSQAEYHLQWIKCARRIPSLDSSAKEFTQLIHVCLVKDEQLKTETNTEFATIFLKGIEVKMFTSLISVISYDGYPPLGQLSNPSLRDYIDQAKTFSSEGFTSETLLGNVRYLNFVFHAFTQLYGFLPLHWLDMFPREVNTCKEEELKTVQEDMIKIISPFALGVNYRNAYLAKCADYVDLFRKEPLKQSSKGEVETIALVRFAQCFLLLHQRTSCPLKTKDLLDVLQMSDPRKVIQFGKSVVVEVFPAPIKWIDNDKVILLYVVSLVLTYMKNYANESFLLNFDENAVECVFMNLSAKEYMNRKDYSEAITLYHRLLQLRPFDAILFGNIAQAYISIEDYESARRCALRSIMISPSIPKNHYRWIKASEMMGKVEDSFRISFTIKTCILIYGYFGEEEHCKDLEAMCNRLCQKVANSTANDTQELVNATQTVPLTSNNDEPELKLPRVESASKQSIKSKAKVRAPKVVKKNEEIVDEEKTKEELSGSTYQKYLHDGSDFFIKSVYKLAVQNYFTALELLRSKGAEALELTDIDVILLKYCYGKACIERSTHEHLRISMEMFNEIIDQNCLRFPMAYYGKGLAFYRLNKFSEALIALEKCLEIISKCRHFEAYLYPGLLNEVINESYRDKLKELVDDLVVNCRTPPVADATCINTECTLTSKIYCTDVEFLGYSRMTCRDKCRVEFHPVCWKEFTTKNKIHGDKEVLGRSCSTPDCKSFVSKLELIGPDSLVRKMLTETVESKPKQSKNFIKPKCKMPQKEVTKQVSKKRVRADSASSNISDVVEERRSLSLEKEQMVKIATSAPDTRNAEKALLILKKSDDHMHFKQPTKKPVSHIEKRNRAIQRQFPIKFVDGERISALQMRRAVAEETTNRSFSVRLDSNAPFAIPSQAASPLVLESYLRRLEPSHVPTFEMGDISYMNSHECGDLKRNVVEYVEQYVIANGPVSITSQSFLDEINSFPTEVQELVISGGGIRSFLSTSRLLFVGGVALMRDNLHEISSGSLFLRSLDLASGCGVRLLRMNSNLTGSRLKTANSIPDFLESGFWDHSASNGTSSSDHVLTDGYENYSLSRVDTLSDEDGELDFDDEEGINKDENCNVLKNKSEISRLSEELQSYKDKLFGLRKETNVAITLLKSQLDEAQGTNEVSQRKIKELESERNNLTKKLAAEKQNAEQEIQILQTKIVDQEDEAAKIWMKELETFNEEKRHRLKLEGDVDTLTKNLAAMESNHDNLVRENRQLKECISSLQLVLKNRRDKEPKKEYPLHPLGYNLSSPYYYYHPKLGAPFVNGGSVPLQYQPAVNHPIRGSSSLENIYNPPTPKGTKSCLLPSPTHSTNSAPLKNIQLFRSPLLAKPNAAVPLTSNKTKDREQLDNFRKPETRRKTPSVSPPSLHSSGSSPPPPLPPHISEVVPISTNATATKNCQTVVEGMLEGCSFSYAAKASVPPKVIPQAQKPEHEIGFGGSEYVNKIFARIKKEFPRMHKSEFLTYLQLVRSSNKNSLTGLKLKVVVSRVRKEAAHFNSLRERSVSMSSTRSSESTLDPPVASGPSFWAEVMGAKTGAKPKKKIGEDVCSICLSHIIECDAHFLQCSARHVFHKKCIREWYFKGEESCPLCRQPASLHEEFPSLNY